MVLKGSLKPFPGYLTRNCLPNPTQLAVNGFLFSFKNWRVNLTESGTIPTTFLRRARGIQCNIWQIFIFLIRGFVNSFF